MKMNKIFLIIILIGSLTFSQVSADLTIENQNVVGTDFLFDIYLTRTGINDLYLGTADFVMTFNGSAFTNPTVVRENSTFWNLTSTSGNPVNVSYRSATSPAAIMGNEIIINLNQISFGDQEEFDDAVARIDNTPNTHRLGRYRVSGINNSSTFMNLQWKSSGAGVTTMVFTLAPVSPWISSQVNINAINPDEEPLPVELTTFTAAAKNKTVFLNWKTVTETNNYGFEVERCALSTERQAWNKIGFVSGNGNSSSDKEYSFTDKNISGGSKFNYRLKQIDNDGTFEYSSSVEIEIIPLQFELSQNYPNPFNPSTTIQFSLPVQTQLKINIYNMLGELIKTVSEGMYESGYYNITFDASELSSGTYIYRLESNDFIETKKMLMIK
jgi:hypothetical protein